jgi:phosphatidylethanolamine-binding protein (PEBP) family uncharacterized protein
MEWQVRAARQGFKAFSGIVLIVGLFWNCIAATAANGTTDAGRLTLSSPAFTDGGTLPAEFTCDGSRASPPLEWSNAPAGTKNFAVTMHHIPGPGDKHVYLVVYNIPADVHGLAKNSKDVGTFGINTVNGQQEYTPPCSKGPGPKKYTMTVYALSAAPKIEQPADAVTMDILLAAIKDTTLATAEINVTYSRPDRGGDDAGPEQGREGPGRPPEQGARLRQGGGPDQRAMEQLNLSDEQKAKVGPILEEFRDKQNQLRDQMLAKLKDVLDARQYQQAEAAIKRRPPPPPQGDKGGDNPPPN